MSHAVKFESNPPTMQPFDGQIETSSAQEQSTPDEGTNTEQENTDTTNPESTTTTSPEPTTTSEPQPNEGEVEIGEGGIVVENPNYKPENEPNEPVNPAPLPSTSNEINDTSADKTSEDETSESDSSQSETQNISTNENPATEAVAEVQSNEKSPAENVANASFFGSMALIGAGALYAGNKAISKFIRKK